MIFWKIKNQIDKIIQSDRGGTGCLAHRKDDRDFGYLGGDSKVQPLAPINEIYNQKPFSNCVFASAAMGASYQEGIRFSVKFYVKVAKKLGYVTGNGWSFLRAARKVSTKFGRLPYEDMPDDKNESWHNVSKWDVTDEQLALAWKYKAQEYRQIKTEMQALDALERGMSLFSANKWYSAMNNPQAPHYLLKVQGRELFGHAWAVDAHRDKRDFRVPNTFGTNWADNGRAWIEDLFIRNNYAVYVESPLSDGVRLNHLKKYYEGKAIKAPDKPEIYEVKNGKAVHIKTMKEFTEKFDKYYTINSFYIKKLI